MRLINFKKHSHF